MHQTKIDENVTAVLRTSPTVIVCDCRPPLLYHNLNQEELCWQECFEVGELCVPVVIWWSFGWVWIVEELHADNAKSEEGEKHERYEFQNNRHYLEKHLEQHPQLHYETKTQVHEVTVRNYSKQTSHSENTTNSGYTASPTLNRQEKEEEAHEDQHGIEVVPSIGEESFRSKGYDPQHQLHQKDPNEYVIQNGSSFPDVIREDERIDKGENDENGNSQLEDPVLNDDF